MSKRRVRLQRRELRPQAQAPDAPLLNSENGSSRTAGEAALRFRQLPDRQRHTDAEPRPGQAAAAGRDDPAGCGISGWRAIWQSSLPHRPMGVRFHLCLLPRPQRPHRHHHRCRSDIFMAHRGADFGKLPLCNAISSFSILCLVSIVDMKITERLDMPGLSTIKRPGLIRQSHISCSDETGRSSQAAQVLKNLCRLAF